VPVAQVCAPSTKPWDGETKVTDAGLKPASETAAAVDGGADGALVGVLAGAAGDETAGADEAAADVPAGAAGDDAAGGLDAAGALTGALLPGEAECVLLEQPAAAIRATSVIAPALVVHEVVMRSRTQEGCVRVHVSCLCFLRRQSNWIRSRAAARR
jgi:hypothetical protein